MLQFDHIYCDISLFKKHDVLKGKQNTIIILDGAQVRVKFIGTVWLNNGLRLNRVLYVPDFKYNLISVHKLCLDRIIKISFVADMCVMQEALKKPLLLSKLKNNLYFAKEKLVPIAKEDFLKLYGTPIIEGRNKVTYKSIVYMQEKMTQNLEKIKLWHLRLRHMPLSRLQIMFSNFQCKDCDKNFLLCTVCPLGKQTKKPFHRSSIKTTDSFQLIHVDL